MRPASPGSRPRALQGWRASQVQAEPLPRWSDLGYWTALLPLLCAWTGRGRRDKRGTQMAFLKTPKKGLLGASLLLLYLWLGLGRAGTPKGHDLPPSPKATSCKVQAGSEWGRCILESCSLDWDPSEGEYGGSSLKNQDSSPLASSMPSPQHGQRQRLS